jgi:hypothetical protein
MSLTFFHYYIFLLFVLFLRLLVSDLNCSCWFLFLWWFFHLESFFTSLIGKRFLYFLIFTGLARLRCIMSRTAKKCSRKLGALFSSIADTNNRIDWEGSGSCWQPSCILVEERPSYRGIMLGLILDSFLQEFEQLSIIIHASLYPII